MKTQIITLLCCCISILGFGQSITDMEYFFNTDPGFGMATPIIVNANTGTVTQIELLPVGNTLTGFNTLYVRAKDNAGVWGLYDRQIFYITETGDGSSASNIAAAEYFFNDNDLGFGNATAIPVDPNSGTLTQTLSLPVGNTLIGFNTLYIRTQDNLGVWSLYDRQLFYITETGDGSSASNIAAAEYFFNDNDPGFGNATSISVNANTGELTQVLALPVNNLDGFNTLYLRTQDDLGEWSLYDKRLFYISIDLVIANITGAEYFYDTDPGFGNGTAAAITPSGNPDEYTIELGTTDVTCDFHDFYIRLQNTDGTWSLYDYGLDVEVFDNAEPTIVVFPNITAELDASGQASITITDVDDGTFDDCELDSVVLNQAQFDYTCADLGTNTVTITATDAESKVSMQDVTITVVDNIDPVAVAQDITVVLGANGTVSITADDLENGSTDNCSIASNSVDITSFDCDNLGANTVNFTVTDPDGNTNVVSAIVTIEDNIVPDAVTQNITVQLDAAGAASITPDDVDLSTDNCTITTKSLNIDTFDCTNLGINTVTLTVTDQSGNSNTATATITVEDVINPTVATQNITVQLDANGNATITTSQIENGSTDNCTIDSSSLDITSFDCSNLGANTVTLTVTDQSTNSNSATAVVTVEDPVNPVAIGQNITVQLNASGSATITATDIDNNSTDNCGIDTRDLDITSFDCDDIGINTVTLTVTDASSNSNATTATVIVEDNVDPSVTTQNITVQLDASGTASIIEADVENTLTDNCGIASSVLDITSFDCNDLGNNTVALTVTDVNSNVTNTSATVTVVDNIDPDAIPSTTTITLELDANGLGSLAGSSYDGGSTDNCSVVSDTVFPANYSCSDLGNNAATFEVTDDSGNTATAAVTVNVVDNLNPTAIGQDITVGLPVTGSVSIVPADVDNDSSDNCGTTVLSIDVDTFTEIGVYPVVLTVTDGSGNTNTVTVNVTVTDSLDIDDEEISSNEIRLYPNPVSDKLFFDTKLTISQVQIFDLTGKKVLVKKNPNKNILVQKLSEGVYFIQFNIEQIIITKRFIKQ